MGSSIVSPEAFELLVFLSWSPLGCFSRMWFPRTDSVEYGPTPACSKTGLVKWRFTVLGLSFYHNCAFACPSAWAGTGARNVRTSSLSSCTSWLRCVYLAWAFCAGCKACCTRGVMRWFQGRGLSRQVVAPANRVFHVDNVL